MIDTAASFVREKSPQWNDSIIQVYFALIFGKSRKFSMYNLPVLHLNTKEKSATKYPYEFFLKCFGGARI